MALTLTTVTDDELRSLEAPSVISEHELAALEDETRELLTSQRPRRSSRILADTLADVEAPRPPPPRANRRSIFGRARKPVALSPPAAARYAPSDSPPRRGRRSVMRGSIFQRFLGGGATAASVKNMMLYNATTANPDRVCFLLGKTGPDEFACDYAYPLTALQAMGLALTAFHDMSRRLNLGLKGGKLGYKSGQGD